MTHVITLIPGDGIGPEVTRAVVAVLETAGLQVEWDEQAAGIVAVNECGQSLPDALIESIKRTKVALKGPVTTPVGGGFTSVNVGLRKALNLFANLRPVWNIPSVSSRYTGVDQVDTEKLRRWLAEARDVQWDYKNLIRRKGRLERLK